MNILHPFYPFHNILNETIPKSNNTFIIIYLNQIHIPKSQPKSK